MFINHELVNRGYQSIFLGFSVPMDSLLDLQNYYEEIIYISYFTVKPEKADINKYIKDFEKLLINNGSNTKLWILGQMLNALDLENLPEGVTAFKNIKSLTDNL